MHSYSFCISLVIQIHLSIAFKYQLLPYKHQVSVGLVELTQHCVPNHWKNSSCFKGFTKPECSILKFRLQKERYQTCGIERKDIRRAWHRGSRFVQQYVPCLRYESVLELGCTCIGMFQVNPTKIPIINISLNYFCIPSYHRGTFFYIEDMYMRRT